MPRDACCWRRRTRNDPDSPVYTKEVQLLQPQELCRLKKEVNVPTIGDVQKTKDTDTKDAGNPRNKCSLQPGHSLMDWIRLGQSGRDLTGVGPRAGTLSISPRMLAEHRHVNDAWTAIRGKVYNITHYLSFHPGGVDELMKGAGRDATALFNEVHAWVNYDSILQKCLVGRLTAVEPDVDTEALFYGGIDIKKTPPQPKISTSILSGTGSVAAPTNTCPRFDWIQKLDSVATIFYTKCYSNSDIQISAPTKQNGIDITFTYDGFCYTNHIQFTSNIHWPCKVIINYETGKIEIVFRKIISKIWDNYGILKQTFNSLSSDNRKIKYIVMNKINVNHNTCVLALQRSDGTKQTMPIGKHVLVHGVWNGQEISRSYTPVPLMFMRKLLQPETYVGDVYLMVKGYPEGMLSPYICNRTKGDFLELSEAIGSFDLRTVENKDAFLLLAAGTGITPMLGLLLFILERRNKSQKMKLLFFNRQPEDILLREQLDDIQAQDNRFNVEYVLSEANDEWQGERGHVNATLLKSTVDHQCMENQLFPVDIFVFVCGPTVFTNLAKSMLSELGYQQNHMHCFLG